MSPPTDPWRDVSAARLPTAELVALAPVRAVAGLRVHRDGAAAWVRLPAGQLGVVRCLLPVPGAVFYTHRGGVWFRFGRRLPAPESPPDGDGEPLTAVLVPGRFAASAPPSSSPTPVTLTVVRGGVPQPASALVCAVRALLEWADRATTAELAAVRGALAGERTVLLGQRLPSIPGATRFWGESVLAPVGFRPEPDLSPVVLRTACGASDGELLLLEEAGAELIPRAAFEPLTRAGVRLGARTS